MKRPKSSKNIKPIKDKDTDRSHSETYEVVVNVSMLKDRLSEYLALAKKGHEVIITEHKAPVAKVVVIENENSDFKIIEAKTPPQRLYQLSMKPAQPKFAWDPVEDILLDRKKR